MRQLLVGRTFLVQVAIHSINSRQLWQPLSRFKGPQWVILIKFSHPPLCKCQRRQSLIMVKMLKMLPQSQPLAEITTNAHYLDPSMRCLQLHRHISIGIKMLVAQHQKRKVRFKASKFKMMHKLIWAIKQAQLVQTQHKVTLQILSHSNWLEDMDLCRSHVWNSCKNSKNSKEMQHNYHRFRWKATLQLRLLWRTQPLTLYHLSQRLILTLARKVQKTMQLPKRKNSWEKTLSINSLSSSQVRWHRMA